jgi:hypothetical protein
LGLNLRNNFKISGVPHRFQEKEHVRHFLQQWTKMESYAKLRDINLYPMIKDRYPLSDAFFTTYYINSHFILTLASYSPFLNDTLVWIDPKEPNHSQQVQKVDFPVFMINGDRHVRP